MNGNALSDQPLGSFIEALASTAPTPGGGAAAALVGALAAGLGRMACALTIGKAKFAAVESQVSALADKLARCDLMLRTLMDEDAAAYADLSAAFKLDKDNAERARRIRRAAQVAARVPLEIAAAVRQVARDLAELEPIGNPNLASDVRCGGHLARAALQAAAENVRVNLPLLADDERAALAAQLDALLVDIEAPRAQT